MLWFLLKDINFELALCPHPPTPPPDTHTHCFFPACDCVCAEHSLCVHVYVHVCVWARKWFHYVSTCTLSSTRDPCVYTWTECRSACIGCKINIQNIIRKHLRDIDCKTNPRKCVKSHPIMLILLSTMATLMWLNKHSNMQGIRTKVAMDWNWSVIRWPLSSSSSSVCCLNWRDLWKTSHSLSLSC